jgi:hypothetical protein
MERQKDSNGTVRGAGDRGSIRGAEGPSFFSQRWSRAIIIHRWLYQENY